MTETITDTPAVPRVTVLYGHTSEETAYIIEDYPYGRTLRCQMRVWVEGPAEKGQYKGQYRVVRQTNNPKLPGVVWNKPHKGQYSDWIVLYRDETNQHIEAHGGAFLHGIDGWQDARMRHDGTVGQLSERDARLYRVLVKMGHRHGRFETWARAVAFASGYLDEHGQAPSWEQVQQVPGFVAYEHQYPALIAEARTPAA